MLTLRCSEKKSPALWPEPGIASGGGCIQICLRTTSLVQKQKCSLFIAVSTNEQVQSSNSQAKELFLLRTTDSNFLNENYSMQTQCCQTYLLWLIACNISRPGLICSCFQLWICTTLFQSPFQGEMNFPWSLFYCIATQPGTISSEQKPSPWLDQSARLRKMKRTKSLRNKWGCPGN